MRMHDKQVSVTQAQTMDNKAFHIRKRYAEMVLNTWQDEGFDAEQMALVFSNRYPQQLASSNLSKMFQQWSMHNQNQPIWDQHKWQAFLAERLLMTMMRSDA